MISDALQPYNKAIMDKLMPFLKKRSKYSYIGAAVLCILAQQVYSFFKVPKQLSRYPSVSFFAMMKSFYSLESIVARNKNLVTPLTNAGHKFYVVKIWFFNAIVHRN
jgi:hypothetical protein